MVIIKLTSNYMMRQFKEARIIWSWKERVLVIHTQRDLDLLEGKLDGIFLSLFLALMLTEIGPKKVKSRMTSKLVVLKVKSIRKSMIKAMGQWTLIMYLSSQGRIT